MVSGSAPSASVLRAAQRHCLRVASRHEENFTVLSWLTPMRLRPHRGALYAFCRTVDDLGDEAEGDRLALLDGMERDLDAAFFGRPRTPLFTALADTIARFDLPRDPFARLIEANRIDQRQSDYATYAELIDYCTHSADPVGRLVLMIHGHRDSERFELSDRICTALQLTNFLQDLRRDRVKGRIYLPEEDRLRFDVSPKDLDAAVAPPGVRDLVRFEVERTRGLFKEGLPLLDRVRGRLRLEIALFSRGGLAVLDAIARQGFDTLTRRPVVDRATKAQLIRSTLVDFALGRRPWI